MQDTRERFGIGGVDEEEGLAMASGMAEWPLVAN